MKRKHVRLWVGQSFARVEPNPNDPPPPPPTPVDDEERQRLILEADRAKAEAAQLAKRIADLEKNQMTVDERERLRQLELEATNAEEERKRKSGEFDSWRTQIETKHAKQIEEERTHADNARAETARTEKELNDTLIGLAFSGATEWFGPQGKTVLLPEIAQSYFTNNVSIEVIPGVGGGPNKRRVIVKSMNGTTIIDTKTGQPLPFDQAIGELIESHPRRSAILRGSGRVGSGSAGGDNGIGDRDLNNLKPSDFKDPKVRERVRDQMSGAGGLQVGPGFDAARRAATGTKP